VAGLGPAIHDRKARPEQFLVDARPKAGHERSNDAALVLIRRALVFGVAEG